MTLLTTRTARTMIYLGCIGGLLVLNSLAVASAWNALVVRDKDSEANINILEGAGVTAFAYVIVLSLRYGARKNLGVLETMHRRVASATSSREHMREQCSKLTDEQKAALKHELITHCGCSETATPERSSRLVD